jgi:hypothetical protein
MAAQLAKKCATAFIKLTIHSNLLISNHICQVFECNTTPHLAPQANGIGKRSMRFCFCTAMFCVWIYTHALQVSASETASPLNALLSV